MIGLSILTRNSQLRVVILEKLAMVASTVSSKMIESMAKAEGFMFAECLTGEFDRHCSGVIEWQILIGRILGFKWIGNTALKLEAEGYEVKFGYEEAIGFMCSPEIRDKDGVTAMVRNFPGLSLGYSGLTVYYTLFRLPSPR